MPIDSSVPALDWRWILGTALAVVAITVVVFLPVLGAQALSFDDSEYLTRNPLVTTPGWGSTVRFVTEVLNPSTVRGYYQPLTMISLMSDYALGGRPDDLRVFHRTNLVLHVTCATLLLILLYRLFGGIVPAAMTAILCAIHPLTVEPVTWISDRKTLLATMLALTAVLGHVLACRGGSRHLRPFVVVVFVLAMLAKPTVLMLPLLLLLLDYWPLRRFGRAAILEKWPLYVVSLIFGIVTVISQGRTAGIDSSTRADWIDWPARSCYVIAMYVFNIFVPTRASGVHELPESISPANPIVALAMIFVMVTTISVLVMRKRFPGLMVAWCFFVGALFPTLGVVKYSWMAASDKYVYWPAVGLAILLCSVLTDWWRDRGGQGRRILCAVVVCAAGLEAVGARTTIARWRDSITLFEYLAAGAPRSCSVRNRLGLLYSEALRPDEAVSQLREAIRLKPDYGEAHYNLGLAMARQERFSDAILHFEHARKLMPDDADTALNLGMSYRLAGRNDDAMASFRAAIEIQPDMVPALAQLADVLVSSGNQAEAETIFRRAIEVSPNDGELHYRLASLILLRTGASVDAIGHLRRALELQPTSLRAMNALSWILATANNPELRNPKESLRLASTAVQMTGGRTWELLDTLAVAQAACGSYEDAVKTAQTAIELASTAATESSLSALRARLSLFQQGKPFRE